MALRVAGIVLKKQPGNVAAMGDTRCEHQEGSCADRGGVSDFAVDHYAAETALHGMLGILSEMLATGIERKRLASPGSARTVRGWVPKPMVMVTPRIS
jgi:hypothetical protein